MAAFYADEEEVWKCPEHPSRRRSIGVCPSCLRERLAALCPECANVRPCGCCCSASASASVSSSSCSSSSVSYISLPNHNNSSARVSSLIENEPSFRRSRSVALFPSLFKSARFSNASEPWITDRRENQPEEASTNKSRSRSFWLFFWPQRTRKAQEQTIATTTEGFATMRRSRSVAVGVSGGREDMMMRSGTGKSRGWYYFPSPMKVFRHSSSSSSNRKTTSSSKIVQERSPLHRG